MLTCLPASGAESVVLGDLDDKRLITEEVMKHDIVFHTATADHLPSVEAVLEGLRKRAEGGRESIFIHTSGTSVLEDNSMVSQISVSENALATNCVFRVRIRAIKSTATTAPKTSTPCPTVPSIVKST